MTSLSSSFNYRVTIFELHYLYVLLDINENKKDSITKIINAVSMFFLNLFQRFARPSVNSQFKRIEGF